MTTLDSSVYIYSLSGSGHMKTSFGIRCLIATNASYTVCYLQMYMLLLRLWIFCTCTKDLENIAIDDAYFKKDLW